MARLVEMKMTKIAQWPSSEVSVSSPSRDEVGRAGTSVGSGCTCVIMSMKGRTMIRSLKR